MERNPFDEASPGAPDSSKDASQEASPSPPARATGPNGLGGRAQATTFDPRDLVPEPIFCCDSDGRFVWVNNAAEKLTGYSTAQLLGQPFSMLIAPTNRRRLSSFFIRQHLREAVESERDVPLLTRDGRTAWVGVRLRRVRTLHGRVGYVACAHDLHDMVFEIEHLQGEARELRAKVVEATGAARLKSEVLSAMSEEIRTPMDGLLGMTRLLLESNLDRDQRTFAEVILSSGQTLMQLVTDILDFSNIEAGKLELSGLDFDVRVTVDNTASVLAPVAANRGVRLVRTVHSDVPSHLKGDPGRLRQVLIQVARRMIELMDAGEVTMWVTLVEETPHRVTLRFSLGFSGSSNAEGFEDLLQVFGQEDLSRCRRLGADALSIALARQIITLMGGEAGVETQNGGRTLWIQIPFQRQEEHQPVGPLPEVEITGMRVLVADPSIGMRMALSEMLTSWGCVPDEVEDGESVLTRMRDAAREGRPYRVALIDMQLPGADGEVLARAVREDRALDGTLLMLLTGLGRRGDAARAQEWGYSAYLVKPFEPTYLYDALVEVVHRGALAPDARGAVAAAPSIVTRHSVAEKRRERLRILVVDDNPVNQLVAVAALRRSGYQPETAATASEAIQSHALHRFDLILMDLELPDLDGIEATAEIYRMEEGRGRRTPIVAVTGHDLPEIRKRCFAVGMQDMLTKPIDLDAMCSGVDRWVHASLKPAEEGFTAAAHLAPAGVEPATAATRLVPAPSAGEPALPSTAENHSVGGGADLERPADAGVIADSPPAASTTVFGEVALPGGDPSSHAGAEAVAAHASGSEPEPGEGVHRETIEGPLPAAPSNIIPLRPGGSPAESPSSEPVLDEARLEASSMGNPELRNILIRTFVNHIRPRLARLRQVSATGDMEAVEFEAHGLKGMCSTIGAMCCADVFGRIERLGREKRTEPIPPMLDYAEVEVGRVEALMGTRSKAA